MNTVIWRGPSRLDGQPLVASVQDADTRNRKIGPMEQLWILPQKWGRWKTVCGDCPLQGTATLPRLCYVGLMVVGAVKRAIRSQRVAAVVPSGAPIRLGAYGDPTALPLRLVRRLVGRRRHTGYTHQWRQYPGFKGLLMASVESLVDARVAWARGWRTFRTLLPEDTLQANEILCPNVTHGVTCAACGLCDGRRYGPSDPRKSIAIPWHGQASLTTIRTTLRAPHDKTGAAWPLDRRSPAPRGSRSSARTAPRSGHRGHRRTDQRGKEPRSL